MGSSFVPRSGHGTMDEREDGDVSAASESESTGSSASDFVDDASSSEEEEGPLFQMSSLMLPFKRGLSKHFQGKSQSFSSLSSVRSLEDLAKPEKTFKRKMNPSKRYGGVLDYNKALFCAKTITKKSSRRGSSSSLGQRRSDVLRSTRPAFTSLRSSGDLSGHALLFA